MKVIYFLLIQTVLIGAQLGVFIVAKNEVKEMKIASLEKQYSDVDWEVDQAAVQKNEMISETYYNNAKRDVYTFQHSGDSSLRVTLSSPAMKLLLKEEYIVVKEGSDDEHLTMTVYFNPLKIKSPEPKDLIMTYQVVKYKKPEIVLEIEKDAELLADKEADVSGIDKDKQLLQMKYPFEEADVVDEVDDYIIYAKDYTSEDMINIDFYRTYLGEGSIYGDYGVEVKAFLDKTEEEN